MSWWIVRFARRSCGLPTRVFPLLIASPSPLCQLTLISNKKHTRLGGCGHTFCRKCLQDWFTTALTQHIAADAQFAALHDRGPEYARHAPRQPSYICPSCRAPVRAPPCENYAYKKLVRTVRKAQGEKSPRKPPRPQGGPFDGFFLSLSLR